MITSKQIIEKQLGISGDYQYKALRGKNYLQANWHNNKLIVLKHIIDIYKPKTVLDLGTGSGNFELNFANILENIVGVDYNDEALTFLSKQLKMKKINNVKLFKRDILNLPNQTPLGKFDLIIMIDVIEHLDKIKIQALVKYFKKLLNKNGKIVIVTPNYGGLWPIIERSLDKFGSVPHLENMQHVTKFDANSLQSLFSKYGYQQNLSSTFNTFSFVFPSKVVSAAVCKIEEDMHLPFGSLLVSVFGVK